MLEQDFRVRVSNISRVRVSDVRVLHSNPDQQNDGKGHKRITIPTYALLQHD